VSSRSTRSQPPQLAAAIAESRTTFYEGSFVKPPIVGTNCGV